MEKLLRLGGEWNDLVDTLAFDAIDQIELEFEVKSNRCVGGDGA